MLIQIKYLSTFQGLFRHLSSRRRYQLYGVLALTVISSIAEMLSLGAVIPFLTFLTNSSVIFNQPQWQTLFNVFNLLTHEDLLVFLTILFGVATLIAGVLRFLLLYCQVRLSHAIGFDFGVKVYEHVLSQSYLTHISRNTSDVIANILFKTDAVIYKGFFPILTILSSVVIFLGIMVTLFFIEPIIALLVFSGFSFIYLVVAYFTKNKLASSGVEVNQQQNKLLQKLNEGLGGIRDVILDGTQDLHVNAYVKSDCLLRKATGNIHIISHSPRYIVELLGMLLITLLLFEMAKSQSLNSNFFPIIGVLVIAAQRMLPIMQQVYLSWSSICGGESTLNEVLNYLGRANSSISNENLFGELPFNKCLSLNNISFKYKPEGSLVLNNLSLKIEKGSKVGIVGSSGSGKSTLMDLVMALLTPTSGELMVDNQVITKFNRGAWQAHIAHVPQSIFLADTTIANNIALSVDTENMDFNRVRWAAEKAGIADVINTFDQKYSTMVGERGIQLSGGQRQRIGIARALYKNCDVIILDEATSALDQTTELEVMSAINSLGDSFTIFIVAHRLSTLSSCDFVVEINDGMVKKICSYDELILENKIS